MPKNIQHTSDRLRRESHAFAAFTHALAARFDPLGRVELTWRYCADDAAVVFQVNGLPAWATYASNLFGTPAVDAAELHFRQAETYRRWTKALR